MIGKLFAWWNDATPGTFLTLAMKGATKVGEDEFGNKYFEEKKATASDGRKRRYVVYKGYADASRVPMAWHGWLHHTYAEPPTGDEPRHVWEKEHQPNLTGTVHAYKPAGSLSRGGQRQSASGDYESWSPEG
jgi:NADH:ubiquinone oxidoreductase subunit